MKANPLSQKNMEVFKQKLGNEADAMNEQELLKTYELLDSLADMLVSSWFEDIPGVPHEVYTDDI